MAAAQAQGGGTAVAELRRAEPGTSPASNELDVELTDAQPGAPERATERRLLRAAPRRRHPRCSTRAPAAAPSRAGPRAACHRPAPLPELAPADLTPGAAARRHPARRLRARARARRPARTRWPSPSCIERSFEERERARRRRIGGRGLLRGVRARTRASTPSPSGRGSRRAAACSPPTRRCWRSGCWSCSAPRGRAAAGRRLPRRARADLGAEDDAAQGGAVGSGRLAPGRRVHGRRALAQPLARAVALRRRGPRPRHRPAAARRARRDADRRGGALVPGLAAQGRGGGRRHADRPARSSSPATRCSSTSCSCTRPARTRRCPTRASRSRTGSSAPPASRASSRRSRSSVDFDPYLNDPERWGVSLAQSAEIMLPCLDAAGARSVVEVGAFAGDLTRVLVALGGGRGRARRPRSTPRRRTASWRSRASTPSSS